MISGPYTHFTRILLERTPEGRYFTDSLWKKDLELHFGYIDDFRICCPVVELEEPTPGKAAIDLLKDEKVFALRLDRGWPSVAANLIPNLIVVNKALEDTRYAHSGGAGWAFPLSYYLLALRRLKKFKWIFVMESSFWMKRPGDGRLSRRRLLSDVHHTLITWCVRAADARIFTQDWYRQIFLGSHDAALVAPATWIDEDAIISEEALGQRLEPQGARPARILFASRLIPDKGVETVLNAMETLEHGSEAEPSRNVTVDIMGEGPLAARCREAAAKPRRRSTLRFLDPVPYGAPFFERLRDYDAVLVPGLQAEQPRIIFDAFAQGVACIASDTSGVAGLVEPGDTGLLFKPGDADALAACLSSSATSPDSLRKLGANGHAHLSGRTHQAMHDTREAFLKNVFGLHDEADQTL